MIPHMFILIICVLIFIIFNLYEELSELKTKIRNEFLSKLEPEYVTDYENSIYGQHSKIFYKDDNVIIREYNDFCVVDMNDYNRMLVNEKYPNKNGKDFRKRCINYYLNSGNTKPLCFDFRHVLGETPTFLEDAFIGLKYEYLSGKIKFIIDYDRFLIKDIEKYMNKSK